MATFNDPQKKFEYYFNIANGLDEKYQKKIDAVNARRSDYDFEKDIRYKEAVQKNADEALQLENKYKGDYAAYSQGYDNSMKDIAVKEIRQHEKEANKAVAEELERENRQKWLEDKAQSILRLKNSYARQFGDAIYNMQKANEEVMKKRAGY